MFDSTYKQVMSAWRLDHQLLRGLVQSGNKITCDIEVEIDFNTLGPVGYIHQRSQCAGNDLLVNRRYFRSKDCRVGVSEKVSNSGDESSCFDQFPIVAM